MHTARAIVWAASLGVVLGCGKSSLDRQPIAARTQPELGWEVGHDRAERAPISLTASDGSGLTLVSVSARAVIEDPLAFTELHLKFHNPEPRRREGRFEIALPPGAAVSRFAMRIGDSYQEGEVLPRQRAQQVYEDFLHRRQDPALLENDAGNEFAARVFPIEPNADKELILSYSQELPQRNAPYRMMLQGLPKLQTLDVEVQVGGGSAARKARVNEGRITLHERDYVPAADLEVRLPQHRPVALRNGNLVVARVVPVLDAPVAAVSGLTVLFDTSASRALGFGAQIERLGALLVELQKSEPSPIDVRLIAFDQTAEEVFRGPVSEFGLRAKAKLLARDALGASNLGAALAYAAEGGAGHARVLLVSDGVVTAGVDDSTRLREAVARLAAHGVRRLDVLAEGGITDRETLRVVTQAGLAESGVVLEARAPAAQLADRLRKAVRDRIPVNLAAATWVYPDALESVQPGDERLVFAELPAGVPVQIELVGAGAEAFDTLETPRPLLERAWARAKIEWMTRTLRELPFDADDARAAQERAITELSVQYRVLSDSTAMLVLEGPAEYPRYGLSQTALASILRVTDRGLEVWDRREQPVLQIARDFDDRPDFREESAEGLGSNGRRRGGGAAPDLGAARGALPEAPSAVQPVAAEAPRKVRAVPEAKGAAFDEEAKSVKRQEARQVPASSGAMPPPAAPAPEPARARAMRSEGAAMNEANLASPRPSAVSTGFGAPGSGVPALARADSLADMTGRVSEKAKSSSSAVDGLASLGASGTRPADDARGAPVPQPALVAGPAQIATEAYEPRLEVAVLTASNLPQAEVQRALRGAALTRAKQCFTRSANPASRERVSLVLAVSDKGTVGDAYVAAGSLSDRAAQSCAIQAMHQARLPKPENGRGSVQIELSWAMRPVSAQRPAVAAKPAVRRAAPSIPAPKLTDAYDGVLADVLARLKDGDTAGALSRASAAHGDDPADVISLVALGEALEAQRDYARAARAYGSLIDLFPSRADLRRMAAERLERLPSDGLALAVDSYRKAAQQRPDQPSGPRALAYALLKQSDRAQAFETLERALERGYDETRFDGVQRILREDLGLVGAAWLRVDPSAESRVRTSLAAHGAQLAKTPSTRFVLQWETDANDVDFHIYDGRGGHAFYMHPQLPSGGKLYADITTGYGPECFAIEGKSRAYPYVLQAHYFARGPMGYGMGRVQVIDHDGAGNLRFGEFPFVIMKDKAFVELARLDAPLR